MNLLYQFITSYLTFTITGSLIFKNFIYIFAFGNPLATLLIPIILITYEITQKIKIPYFLYLHGILALLYGIRLIWVFIRRMKSWKNWDSEAKKISLKMKKKNISSIFMIWLTMGISGILMISPFIFLLSEKKKNIFFFPGFLISILGLIFEEISDQQKFLYKKKNIDKFCQNGFYKKIRRPNYLGEIIFWFGFWISAIGSYKNFFSFFFSLSGFLFLFFLMINAGKRLDKKQEEKYGEEFLVYKRNTSLMLFI